MRLQEIGIGCYYHILNRGNERQNIFFERENYLFFMRRLKKYIEQYGPRLICYCLMPNHFHLCFEEVIENGISRLMLALQTSYAKAINKRFGRVGHLFQDSYRYVLVDKDEYLLHLSRYIHLNPVNAGLVRRHEEWEFSSYRDYIGVRNGRLPNPGIVLSYFNNREAYRQFVEEYQEELDLEKYTLE